VTVFDFGFWDNSVSKEIKEKEMKRHFFVVLAIIGSVNMLNGDDSINLEQHVKMKQKAIVEYDALDKLVVTINIQVADAISEGEKTLKSLEENFDFLEKIESDADFRECVVLKDNQKRLLYSKSVAHKLLKNRKITQPQHDKFIEKQFSRENILNKNISKFCK